MCVLFFVQKKESQAEILQFYILNKSKGVIRPTNGLLGLPSFVNNIIFRKSFSLYIDNVLKKIQPVLLLVASSIVGIFIVVFIIPVFEGMY